MALGMRAADLNAKPTANAGAANSINVSRPKMEESAWQRGLRTAGQASAPAEAPMPTPGPMPAAAPAPMKPTIGPGLTMADGPSPMTPMQAPVPPPTTQALDGLRAAVGQTGGDQYGAQAPPAMVPPNMGQRLYPQGSYALAQRLPRVY